VTYRNIKKYLQIIQSCRLDRIVLLCYF